MSIDWRLVLFELLNFVLLMILLSRFLFRPLREVLAARHAEREQFEQGVRDREAEAEALKETYEGKLAGVAAEGEQIHQAIRREAEERAEELVESARSGMSQDRERFEADLQQSRSRALESLEEEIVTLAVEGASRVVVGMGDPRVAVAYARAGAQELAQACSFPEEARVQLWTSPDAEREEVARAVAELLPARCVLEVEVDEALVGGVRIAFRDLEVEASAGASLKRWLAQAHDRSEVVVG